MNKKKILSIPLASLLVISGLTGCVSTNVNESPESAVNGFVNGIKDYNYETFSNSSTTDLLENSNIVVNPEENADAISLYGEPIEVEEFNRMYRSLLGGLIVDFKITKTEETKYKTVSEEDEANSSSDDTESEEKDTKDETSESNTEDTDSKETYYKVSGVLSVPNAEDITNDGVDIFTNYVDTIFANKLTSRTAAKDAMIRFFSESFKEVYQKASVSENNVCFYVLKDSNGKYKVNDTDMFISMFESYEAANNAVNDSGMYTNDNAYDAYLRIYLTDSEYKTYRETGELPDTTEDTDSTDTSSESSDSGNSTSWKNNQE